MTNPSFDAPVKFWPNGDRRVLLCLVINRVFVNFYLYCRQRLGIYNRHFRNGSAFSFEPVTTIATLVEANEPPDALIRQALPLTALFTLGAAVLVSFLYGWSWARFAVILLTCAVLVLLLGLNISAIGLVFIPRGSLYLIMELFGLILALNVVYAAAFTALERKSLLPVADS